MADPLISRLRELAPFSDDRAAMRALEATVSALWTRLYPEERAKLAADLPSPVAERLRATSPPRAVKGRKHDDIARLAADVARKEDVPLARATEHAEIVCRALAELLPAATRSWLGERLPEVAQLFELGEPLDVPPDPGPIQPASERPEIPAHRHSVARSDDPHAKSKLSSARGLSQERQQRTLASGRPGSRRPLSGGR